MKQNFKQNCLDTLQQTVFASTYFDFEKGQYAVYAPKLQTALDIVSQYIDLSGFEDEITAAANNMVQHKDFAWEPAKWQTPLFSGLTWFVSQMPFAALAQSKGDMIDITTETAIREALNKTPSEGKAAIIEIFTNLCDTIAEIGESKFANIMDMLELCLKMWTDKYDTMQFLGTMASVDQYEKILEEIFECVNKVPVESFPGSNFEMTQKYSQYLTELAHIFQNNMSHAEAHKNNLSNGKYDVVYQPESSSSMLSWCGDKDNIAYKMSRVVDNIPNSDSVDFAAIQAEICALDSVFRLQNPSE